MQAVKRLLANASSKDKELREFPGGFHELLMGPEKEQAVQTLRDWILKRSAEPEAKLWKALLSTSSQLQNLECANAPQASDGIM